jgi:pimeloyl-ACP methyl ester carboxylesterase
MSVLIIHTLGDGVLGDTTPEEVAHIAEQVSKVSHAVLHFHGGLVSKQDATAMAYRLAPYYEAQGLLPVFFVWESGLLETIRNNAKEIINEKIFRVLLKKLLKWAGGKVVASLGARRDETAEPLDDGTVEIALAQARVGASEPLSNLPKSAPVTLLKEEEERRFAKELRESREFRDAVDSLMLGLGTDVPMGRSVSEGGEPQESLISDEIKDELRRTANEGERGLFDPTILIIHATAILARIIRRLVQHRDHGLYATVVEEILRELYLDAIGTMVWGMMKKDTLDTFAEPRSGAPRGGRLFVEELGRVSAASSSHPCISIVGHSAGSIFTANLLAHVDQQRKIGKLPVDFRFHRIAFLAPACQSALWAVTLGLHETRPLWDEFRMYSLSDKLEAGYWEVPVLYPRSLLYMISGILEAPEYDIPILGMQRYQTQMDIYTTAEVAKTRAFLADSDRGIWSIDTRDKGLGSDALKHGGFDQTDVASGAPIGTMLSVVYYLNQ